MIMKNLCKTIFIMIMTGIMFSLGGCNSKTDEAYESYRHAVEQIQNPIGISMDIETSTIYNSDSNEEVEIITLHYEKDTSDPNNWEIKILESIENSAGLFERAMYIKDGVLYLSGTENDKSKGILPQVSQIKYEDSLLDFPTDSLRLKSADYNDDTGVETLTFIVPSDSINEYYLSEEYSYLTSLLVGITDPVFFDLEITAVLDGKNELVEVTFVTYLEFVQNGEKQSKTITEKYNNIVLGKIDIEFPTDLMTYPDIDVLTQTE